MGVLIDSKSANTEAANLFEQPFLCVDVEYESRPRVFYDAFDRMRGIFIEVNRQPYRSNQKLNQGLCRSQCTQRFRYVHRRECRLLWKDKEYQAKSNKNTNTIIIQCPLLCRANDTAFQLSRF